MNDDWKEIEQQVFIFFREHPIHAFKVEQVAKYLNFTEKEVKEAMYHLEALEIIELRYQYATSGLAGLIDDMTREK